MSYSLPNTIFNVRIYGILVNNEAILISDEIHADNIITKFPGGGLQFGEGTQDCLKREFMEELSIEIEVKNHFYTVDFFQPSAFDASQQVISIYYFVESVDADKIPASVEKYKFKKHENGAQLFRWLSFNDISPEEFTFPIDKRVASYLNEYFRDYKNSPS